MSPHKPLGHAITPMGKVDEVGPAAAPAAGDLGEQLPWWRWDGPSAPTFRGARSWAAAAACSGLALAAVHAQDRPRTALVVCDLLLLLALLAYPVLRLTARLGPGSERWACLLLAWAASLLISAGAPSRRRRALGGAVEACGGCPGDGGAALWIGLLLVVAAVVPDTAGGLPRRLELVALGSLATVQHLALGLLLEPDDCRGQSSSSEWLALPALAAVLALGHPARGDSRRLADQVGEYLAERWRSSSLLEDCRDTHANRVEQVVRIIEEEEFRGRLMLERVDPLLGSAGPSAGRLADAVAHLCEVLGNLAAQLCDREMNSAEVHDQLARDAECLDAQFLSSWLQHAPQDSSPVSRSSTASSLDDLGRGSRLTKTVAGVRADLRVGEWDFDAIRTRDRHRNIVQIVGFELLRTFSILPRGALAGFLELLEAGYEPTISYHNNAHAADVANSFYFLVTRSEIWQHKDTAMSDISRIGSIVAALGHDVGHFGRNNLFLVATRHALAVTYNDRSVMEGFHASSLVRLVEQDHRAETGPLREKLLGGLPSEHGPHVRQLIVALVLTTDPSKHLEDLSTFRVRIGADSFDPLNDPADQQQALCMLLKAADIGHSAKGWTLHQDWSLRVVQEFHAQGDEERRMGLPVSPLCEREGFVLATSQVGFLKFICVPTFKELSRLETTMHLRASQLRGCQGGKHRPSTHCGSHLGVTHGKGPRRSSLLAGPAGAGAPGPGAGLRRSSQPDSGPHARGAARSGSCGPQALLSVLPSASAPPGQLVAPGPPPRDITEQCLGQCERNLQRWAIQAEQARSASRAGTRTSTGQRAAEKASEPACSPPRGASPAPAAGPPGADPAH